MLHPLHRVAIEADLQVSDKRCDPGKCKHFVTLGLLSNNGLLRYKKKYSVTHKEASSFISSFDT